MRHLLLGTLAALTVACGKAEEVSPVTFQRRPGRPGERFAVRVEHKTINQVSPHQAVETAIRGSYVDEVLPGARVVRSGSAAGEPFRLELTRREGRLVDGRGERHDEFEQFEALLPTRAVRPGDRWQVRDFWGTWGFSFPAPAPKLKSVRAACVYRGAEGEGRAAIHVEMLAETVKGPWALQGSLVYDLAAEMLVRVELRGTGQDLAHEFRAERERIGG